MSLNEEAGDRVDELFAEFGVTSVSDARTVAALVWLDGYAAGMKATKDAADAALADLKAAQS